MKKYILLFLCFFIGSLAYSQSKITGYYVRNVSQQLSWESKFDQQIDLKDIGNHIKLLSAFPHHLGSEQGKKNAEYIRDQFIKYGWDAEIDTMYVLFPTPKERELTMVAPTTYKALLKEPGVKEDPTSGQKGQLPTYNAYCADGDVTAGLVFVNYGLPSDYEVLDKMGISVAGKIVIVKYGHSWRGTKPKVAQEHGAVGCIIYSDPIDDGYFAGDVYPKGPFKNKYGVQRGSVMDLVYHPGDPLTPGYGATKDAKRIDRSEAITILKIPVLPISYHDATPLLQSLGGRVVPMSWHGGLPFTYHFGDGETKVHLKAKFNWDIVPCYDVIARIKGSEFPDEWVIRGNHHDAWVNGASDPISGQAAMLEEAKAIGELMKQGWKPKGTLVYCAWDGEEPGLLGSTEWVEKHEAELKQKAVVYINSDNNGRGFLNALGSHALEPFVTEIAKSVTDPQTGSSVYDRKKASEAINARSTAEKTAIYERDYIRLKALGSGSDYSSFIQHAGIPALNLFYSGENHGGDYHSIYDSYYNFVHFKDPGFAYAGTLSRTVGRAVMRMANADVLPFHFSHLYRTVNGYVTELESMLKSKRASVEIHNKFVDVGEYKLADDPTKHFNLPKKEDPVPYLDFSELHNAMTTFQRSVKALKTKYNHLMQSDSNTDQFNKQLYQAEQQLLTKQGLPRRPWYKHTLYAPGFYTGYGVKTMPGIREAIEQNNWKEAQEQISIDAKVLNDFAEYLRGIAAKR